MGTSRQSDRVWEWKGSCELGEKGGGGGAGMDGNVGDIRGMLMCSEGGGGGFTVGRRGGGVDGA